jgi:hypothetical protein
MKAALQRSQSDMYGSLLLGDAPHELSSMEQRRREQRERFNTQFEQVRAHPVAAVCCKAPGARHSSTLACALLHVV